MRLFVYVEGYDNQEVTAALSTQLGAFAESHRELGVVFVNNRDAPSNGLRAGDLPRWDLGLNLPMTFVAHPSFDLLLQLLQDLASSTSREFVLGVEHRKSVAEDVAYVPSHAPLEAKLRLQQYLASVPPE